MSVDRDLLPPGPMEAAAVGGCLQQQPAGAPPDSEPYHYGSNLTWATATPESADDSEGGFAEEEESEGGLGCGSPAFVLARGHITPNNLLPGWDDEDEGPWGPRKGMYHSQPLRRSGQIATFDERLHEVGSWH